LAVFVRTIGDKYSKTAGTTLMVDAAHRKPGFL